MWYSLINVEKIHKDGKVSGSWLQQHFGTIESATEQARKTIEINGNKLRIAVVDQLPCNCDGCWNKKPLAVIDPIE